MPRVEVTAEAQDDMEDAYRWYERQRAGLGKRFLREVKAAETAIGERPHSFPFVYRDMRRAMVNRFPYGVFFIERADNLLIVAVTHLHRDPQTWQSRR